MSGKGEPSANSARAVQGNTGEEIQRAIDSLPDGGVVVLRPDRYSVSRTVVVHDGIRIIGAGPERTFLELLSNSSCHMFTNRDHARGNRDISIEGFSVEGHGDQQPKPPGQKALSFCNVGYFKGVRNLRFTNASARNIRQTAVHFNACSGVLVHELVAERLGWSGVSTSGTDSIVISSSFVRDAGRDVLHSGIHIDGGDGVRIVDVSVSSCTGNAIMLDSSFLPLAHCDVVRATCVDSKRGISLSGSGKHELRNVAIRAVACRHNREVGVLVSNATDVFICDLIVEASGESGVLLQGRNGARRCTIAGCTFIGNERAIEEIHASADNTLIDNRFVANSVDVVSRINRAGASPTPAVDVRSASSSVGTGPAAPAPTPERPTADPKAERSERAQGRCWVCGARGWFVNRETSIREGYRCEACSASVRYQATAAVLVQLYSQDGATCVTDLAQESAFRRLRIYEPGVLGPFRKILRELPNYEVSDFWPDVPRGMERDGVRCENLMNLTYPDASFDVLITSDIFEHVRRPREGFQEIRRVLREGGTHVFSIPVMYPLPRRSVTRVDASGDDDVLLMEARYHKGPGDSRHIVYTDFGADLVDELREIGLRTEVVRFEPMFPNSDRVVTFYSSRTG